MNFTTECGENRHTDIANFATFIHKKKLIHVVAIFTILYGNYYPPHGEFKLICIGKFPRQTWVNFTQQYGKNCQRCQQDKFTMLYGNYCYIFIENFPQKFSPCRGWSKAGYLLLCMFVHVGLFICFLFYYFCPSMSVFVCLNRWLNWKYKTVWILTNKFDFIIYITSSTFSEHRPTTSSSRIPSSLMIG